MSTGPVTGVAGVPTPPSNGRCCVLRGGGICWVMATLATEEVGTPEI